MDSDQLRQQLIFERAEHQKELKDSQAQIDELRKQNDRLRRRPPQNDLVPGTTLFRSFLFLDKNVVPRSLLCPCQI